MMPASGRCATVIMSNVFIVTCLQLECDKDALQQEKCGLEQQLTCVEHDKHDVITQKSGNYLLTLITVLCYICIHFRLCSFTPKIH